jgi:hypothetical protein
VAVFQEAYAAFGYVRFHPKQTFRLRAQRNPSGTTEMGAKLTLLDVAVRRPPAYRLAVRMADHGLLSVSIPTEVQNHRGASKPRLAPPAAQVPEQRQYHGSCSNSG